MRFKLTNHALKTPQNLNDRAQATNAWAQLITIVKD